MNNKKKRTNQKGFTLIELMIVVAVIGVLSAIAIPQYQKYVAKAEVASALATLTGVKTNVEAYSVENGTFPAAGNESDLGIPASLPSGAITFAASSSSAGIGTITFKFASSGVSTLLTDNSFALKRDTSGTWTCGKIGTSVVDASLLPKSCQNTVTAP
ncbi:pilin [Vibrio crassostreae]|uniref:pilin n=1 Tax=Vibrio crassostreae TaxID=246167 RepID=UPI001B309B73|nr:pilin [Vibrio crassostreae]